MKRLLRHLRRSNRRVANAIAARFVREDRRWARIGLVIAGFATIASIGATIYSWQSPYQNDDYTFFFCYGFLAINRYAMSWGYGGEPLSIFAADLNVVCVTAFLWAGAFAVVSTENRAVLRRRVRQAFCAASSIVGLIVILWLSTPWMSISLKPFPGPGFASYVGQGSICRYSYHPDTPVGVRIDWDSDLRWTPLMWHIEAGQGGFGVYYCDLPLWIPCILFGMPALFLFHVMRQLPDRYCHKCLYDLTGNQSGTCSECGAMIRELQREFLAIDGTKAGAAFDLV